MQQVLNTSQVFSNVRNSHISSDGIIIDVCDGNHCKSHELFRQDDRALQVIAYYDDVEVVNPLGSKRKKHKVGMLIFLITICRTCC